MKLHLQDQPLQVLVALIARPGELVSREELRARLWPEGTFVEFDDGLNAAIARLRQVLGDSAESPLFIQTVPRQGYRFIAPISSSGTESVPVAALPAEQAAKRSRLGPVATTAAVLLAVAIAVFAVLRPRPSGMVPPVGRVMLAVLPFENLSGDARQEYFSDGLTEEMITQLARLHPERLGVIARTSVARYKKTTKSVGEIGRELEVDYVVEGSVRREGDRVRITAQLIDVRNQSHRWAESYDRDLAGVLVLQSEIARGISKSLQIGILPTASEHLARARPVKPAAYDAYLRGWGLVQDFHGSERPQRLADAREHFERALELDPNYALALAGLSLIESFTYFFGIDTTPLRLERAERLARQALAIDQDLGFAHIALGDVHGSRREWDRAIAAYRAGLRLEPHNAYGWEELAWAFNSREPPDAKEAERAAREAVRLVPGWFWAHYQLGWALRLQSRYAEAIDALQYAVQVSPDFSAGYEELAEVHLAQRSFKLALAELDKARGQTPSGYVLALTAMAHAGLGDDEKAIAELARAFERGYRRFAVVESSPHFERLRGDPRFQRLLRRYRS